MTNYITCRCGRKVAPTDVICSACGILLKDGSLLGRRFKLKNKLETKELGWIRYKAFDVYQQRDICINVLRNDDPDMRRCLEDWVNSIKGLVHSNIVTVLGFYRDEKLKKSFITMEDISDRKSLRELLKELGRFSYKDVKKYILDICDAISYAHTKGIYHGDIRPENIIIGLADRMRLMNFSLAQTLKKANIPISEFISGDFHLYENLVKETGEKADIYQVSFLIYEMITGSLPKGEGVEFPTNVSENLLRLFEDLVYKKELPYSNMPKFKRFFELIDQHLVRCKVCGWGNPEKHLFCEECGNLLKRDISLGNFRLEKRLDLENLLIGIKYLARDEYQEKGVLVYIFPDYIYRPEITKSLKDCYDSVKDLQDEKIVRVLGFFEDSSKRCKYLVKEYLEEWPTIKKFLSNGKGFSEKEIIQYALEICKALRYAHSKAILHLDLRPENIILKPGGGVMLDNFRLAWVVKHKKLWHLPASVKRYEVSEPIQRSDIYQFGLVLYEMINNSFFDSSKGFVFPENFNKVLIDLVKRMLDKSQSTSHLNIGEIERVFLGVKP